MSTSSLHRCALPAALVVCSALLTPTFAQDSTPSAEGWLSWRGPLQTGASLEKNLFETVAVGGENHLWSYDIRGRGTPVVANGRVYAMGYEGEAKDLQEVLVCLDEATGKLIWERRHSDFLSDVIYDRYSISSPTVDAETGNVYYITSPGLFCAVTADGKPLWEVALQTQFGRITFPNGRTGAPIIDGDLVMLHIITAHWGKVEGPARDRFYAFDKTTGQNVWYATPGTGPKDSPYSYPVLGWAGGKRVLYSGAGCGNLVCIDARTGDNLWRYRMATGGVNSSVLLHGDGVIAIHGRENMDNSKIGRMVKIRTGTEPKAGEPGPVELDVTSEIWRNDLGAFTSSPVLVGDRVYVTVQTGELCCVDANTGELLWHEKLAPDQIHASPLAADGKLYVPMNNGTFWIIKPSDEGAQTLASVQLEGNCLGAPSLWNGRMYVHTTERLYCFGTGEGAIVAAPAPETGPPAGKAVRLQVVPADGLYEQGAEVAFSVRSLDANGKLVAVLPNAKVKRSWGPPPLLFAEREDGPVTAGRPGMGMVTVEADGLEGTARVRVVPRLPIRESFDTYELAPHPKEEGVSVAGPPPHWIGAKLKFDVRELDGEQVLAKTLDRPLFQRAVAFFGHPENSNYTMQVDIMTDGNRRTMSTAGVIHQRYLIKLDGNYQELEISSNVERIQVKQPFKWKPNVWYTLKTRVDVAADGSGVVRAKVWKRDDPEPEAWTLEVEHADAHKQGAPGLLGFAPQSRFRVYVDNLSVTPNE